MRCSFDIEQLTFRLNTLSLEDLEEIRISAKHILQLGLEAVATRDPEAAYGAIQALYDHVDHLLSLHYAGA